MKVYSGFVRALHNFGLSRLIAMYLHFGHGVGYREVPTIKPENHFGHSEAPPKAGRAFPELFANTRPPGRIGRTHPSFRCVSRAKSPAIVQIRLDFQNIPMKWRRSCCRVFHEVNLKSANPLLSAERRPRRRARVETAGSLSPQILTGSPTSTRAGLAERSHQPLGEPSPSPGAVVR